MSGFYVCEICKGFVREGLEQFIGKDEYTNKLVCPECKTKEEAE